MTFKRLLLSVLTFSVVVTLAGAAAWAFQFVIFGEQKSITISKPVVGILLFLFFVWLQSRWLDNGL